ncbi:hypothetical protein WR25_17684 isoform E [Diploscapter pachys]|uniref:G-protein coupled receptors family 1 profile domain-containing protein n=2 Tax=Diploscapter pachys TaxID=2018661 RepID=A0A2A2KS29_9BILA|nr:hypothetical protein WR25_17684 isoform B [Diploscapter pachys]PAV76750.1 hypothetical protein WR25_17684 isoform E [Diploscapter pachys]
MSNNTNTTIEEYALQYGNSCMYDPELLDEPYVRYPLISIYIFVFLLCFFGNIFTMLVICTHPQMRTATNFFLANLAAADFLVAIFCILQNMIHIVGFNHASWPLGETLCQMYLLVLHLVPCASVAILVAVSLEKYLAVLHPLTALKVLTHRLRVLVTIAIWLVSLLMNMPHFYTAKHFTINPDKSLHVCMRERLPTWITISFFVWYVFPLCTLAYIYCRIGLLLCRTGSLSNSTRRSSESQSGNGTSWHMVNGRMVAFKRESLLQVPNGSTDRKQQKRRRQKEVEGRRKVKRNHQERKLMD